MRKEPALTLADMSATTGVCVAAVWKLLAHLIEKKHVGTKRERW